MRRGSITVLYLVTELDVGGAERNLYELARRADRTRFRPVVAALSGGGKVAGWLNEAAVPVHDLNVKGRLDLGCLIRLVRLLRRERVDILHSFLFHANLIGRVAAAIAGVPVVISSVRVAEHGRPWHVWLDGLTSWLVDVETVVSGSVERFVHARAGVPLRKLVTIRNGVDVSRFAIERSRARSELGLDESTPVVAFVGRFVRQKGADLIAKVVRRVHQRIGNVKFLLVGAGPLEEKMRIQIARFGLGGVVDFLGQRDDVPVVLCAADVLMLPSRWEGLANVIMEAQAARTVVVASDVEGSREAIEPGVTGVVVPARNTTAMADAIADLLSDVETRRAVGQAARQTVAKGLTVERMSLANYTLYERLLLRKCRPGVRAYRPPVGRYPRNG